MISVGLRSDGAKANCRLSCNTKYFCFRCFFSVCHDTVNCTDWSTKTCYYDLWKLLIDDVSTKTRVWGGVLISQVCLKVCLSVWLTDDACGGVKLHSETRSENDEWLLTQCWTVCRSGVNRHTHICVAWRKPSTMIGQHRRSQLSHVCAEIVCRIPTAKTWAGKITFEAFLIKKTMLHSFSIDLHCSLHYIL